MGRPRSNVERYTPQQVAAAIIKHRGLITRAADELGCAPQTVYNYRDKYPDIIEPALTESRDRQREKTELALYELIDDKAHPDHFKAVRYGLSASPAGKAAGWGERQEVTGAGGAPLSSFDVGQLSVELQRKLLEEMEGGEGE